jgi:hypothetical protein
MKKLTAEESGAIDTLRLVLWGFAAWRKNHAWECKGPSCWCAEKATEGKPEAPFVFYAGAYRTRNEMQRVIVEQRRAHAP